MGPGILGGTFAFELGTGQQNTFCKGIDVRVRFFKGVPPSGDVPVSLFRVLNGVQCVPGLYVRTEHQDLELLHQLPIFMYRFQCTTFVYSQVPMVSLRIPGGLVSCSSEL